MLSPRYSEALKVKPEGVEEWGPRAGQSPRDRWRETFVARNPKTVAEQIERGSYQSDVDGFNIGRIVLPGSWGNVADLMVPGLEAQGGLLDCPVPGGTV